ncbi:hypothetical protein VPNG_08222 [Cytospora leucostoma]|uniref:Condensation domain-containing protein n=1 Tax=Cytospora leucostoma TaxID=1230097 RepID=A0A423W793_9PEZI|nr:hypothetical protein VPNG_08222 [Cytospora leucostoma]
MPQDSPTQTIPPSNSVSRPLGNLEVFFKTLADLGTPVNHEHWTVHLALRLRFVSSNGDSIDPEPYLRRAWQVVRRQVPAIGSTITSPSSATSDTADPGDDKTERPRERLTVTPFDADAWINDTFVVHHGRQGEDADTLFTSLRPSPTAMFYWLPVSSEVVIRSSHWRLDGIGLTKLAHSFLTALADVLRLGPDAPSLDAYTGKLPASSQPLPPCLEDLARQVRLRDNRNDNDKSKDNHSKGPVESHLELGADELVAEFLRGVPSIGLPTREGSAHSAPGASARASTRLSAADTARVTAALRARDLSFTGAVHAAIARVTARHPQHPLCKSYAAFFPINLRQSLAATAVVAEEELVFGLYFSGLPVCIDGMVPVPGGDGKGFDDVAREMTAVYRRDLTNFWKTPDGQVVSMLGLAEPYLARTTALFSAPVPEGLPPVQTPDLSGLGRVETYLQREYGSGTGSGKVEVDDLWIATEMLNRSVQFHVWSWRDQLNIAASFNKSFYDHEFVAEELGSVVEELQTGLGVKL